MSLATAQAWQLTALILAVLLATRRWTQRKPHLAHVLWLLVLIKCLTPPLWQCSVQLVLLDADGVGPVPAAIRAD